MLASEAASAATACQAEEIVRGAMAGEKESGIDATRYCIRGALAIGGSDRIWNADLGRLEAFRPREKRAPRDPHDSVRSSEILLTGIDSAV